MEETPQPSPDDENEVNGCGCLIVAGLALFDARGMSAALAGRYAWVIHFLALTGFIGGAVLGGYLSSRKPSPTPWSPYYWLIYGLIGLAIPVFANILVHSR